MSKEKIDPAADNAVRKTLCMDATAYQLLLNNLPQKIFFKNPESRYVFCNEAYAKDLKLKPEDLAGKTDYDFFPRELAEKYRADDKRIMASGAAEELDEEYLRDGEKRIVHTAKTPVKDEQGRTTGILGIFWDITGKAAEEASRESEAKFRSIFTHASDLIFLLDVPREGMPVILEVSDSAGRLLGYAREELVGKPISFLDPGLTAEVLNERRKAAFAGMSFEAGHRCKDGTVREFECSVNVRLVGQKALAVSVERDITERRKAEADMRESYEIQGVINSILRHSLTPLPLQKKLADNLAALLSTPWLAVLPKGAVFLLNGQTLTLTAHQGLVPALLASCAKLPLGKCLCGRAAASGKVVTSTGIGPDHEISYDGITPHGHYCAPIIAAGKILGVLNLYLKEGTAVTGKRKDFVQAVTDIIASDILRARAEEQFLQSQKMEAIGQLAGGVAHDFNNILTAIMGYSEFLRAALPAGDPKYDDVEQIMKAGKKASVLTHQLLTFSRKQIVQFKVLSLDQIVPEMAKMLRRMVPEDIEFKTALDSAPALVLANQGQLEQLILNLALNARDAMPDGGKLTFETARVEGDANYTADHPEAAPGGYVMLTVSDTGRGMSPEVAARIFEPFFTTKEQGKGTGLGLSTVYGIVKQSGGSIFVDSEPGKGAAFRIYLPIAAEKTEEKPAGKPSLSSYRGTETILLVEDEEAVRKFVCRALSQSGYSVLEAATPREAIKLCELRRDIHLMITDIVMPQMNGYELARTVSAMIPLMKVIFMSGYTDNTLTRRDILQSGRVLLEKPLKLETVLRKVREVLEAAPQ
ncbi:MAG: PAS domain S-box protein [Elusimicrobia bacterium]|nr:PAS domain S-box protein [Elusimicrobiota bacterium]